MKKLEVMSRHCDGSHCGLTDWYSDIESGIQEALNDKSDWTTGWYSSKKEIASACIECENGKIKIMVSVSDDFDTSGHGEVEIDHSIDLEKIREAIFEAWSEADDDRKNNESFIGFSIIENGRWVETYVSQKPSDWGIILDHPPGDNYHDWGFQDEYEIPEEVKSKLSEWADSWIWVQEDELTVGGFTIKPWKD